MPRYVILEHDHPTLHWDLMIESGPVLRTWRLTRPPRPNDTIPVEASFDHRLVYLDYEGPISGGRGSVTRWDRGTCEIWEAEGNLHLRLDGERLSGEARIVSHDAGRGLLLQMQLEAGKSRHERQS